ncbi:hypothetical protein D9615_002785 [Tricholomella constricta]|uniref:SHSP domain-containing protein n=1 Tax=Tricholomella constricta TaxID=117010 RepID=A0A8H5M6F5_9AGAR|nr:hypothetical protein D9615_002785 [Tricholomella constricta]
MSISRQLVRDLFRMLEEPLVHPGRSSYFGGLNHVANRHSLFDGFNITRPAIDVKEEGDKYVVEAEVPGVQKDNIEVRIGDAGRSVTIEGKVVETRRQIQSGETANATTTEAQEGSTAVAHPEETGNQLSSERTFVGNTSFRRTVWLPRPVDGSNVVANLDHGILTVNIPKAEDKGSVVVPIH